MNCFSNYSSQQTGEDTTTPEPSDDTEEIVHSPAVEPISSDLFLDLENRQQGLREAFEAPDSDAVFVLASGTGAPEAIAGLPTKLMNSRPKLFIGQGDVTCAHCFVQEWWDWPTVYAPNIDQLLSFVRSNDPEEEETCSEMEVEAIQTWTSVVMGHTSCIFMKGLLPLNEVADQWRSGEELVGRIVGGELSSLSKGTHFNKLFIFEF